MLLANYLQTAHVYNIRNTHVSKKFVRRNNNVLCERTQLAKRPTSTLYICRVYQATTLSRKWIRIFFTFCHLSLFSNGARMPTTASFYLYIGIRTITEWFKTYKPYAHTDFFSYKMYELGGEHWSNISFDSAFYYLL